MTFSLQNIFPPHANANSVYVTGPLRLPKKHTSLKNRDRIAAVDNHYRLKVNFVPVDHCIELRKADGKMDNRCDGCLFYEDTIIFVELKQRKSKGSQWIKDGEQQLRSTIGYFEQQEEARNFPIKKACIANSERPLFRTGQAVRMERFFLETNYILRIENRINIE